MSFDITSNNKDIIIYKKVERQPHRIDFATGVFICALTLLVIMVLTDYENVPFERNILTACCKRVCFSVLT